MPEKNFEEQMENILGKLQLQPAGKVWSEVEKRIHNKRKRRPIFWLPIVIAAMAGAGIFYFSADENNEGLKKQSVSEKKTNNSSISGLPSKKGGEKKDETVIKNTENYIKENNSSNSDRQPLAKQLTISPNQNSNAQFEVTKFKLEKKGKTDDGVNATVLLEQQKIKPDTISVQAIANDEKESKQIKNESVDSALSIQSFAKNTATETVVAKTEASVTIKASKWEKGIAVNAGGVSYATGFNLLNAFGGGQKRVQSDQFNSSSSQGNITQTSITQHAMRGYFVSAGYFMQRNFKKISIQSGIELEHFRFTNYQTVKSETFSNTTTGASSGLTSISTSFSTNTEIYKFSGVQIPIRVMVTIAKGDNKSLLWSLGLPQQFLLKHSTKSFLTSGQYFNPSSRTKSFYYQPGVELGMNYTAGRKFKFSVGPYFSMGLKKMKVGADQSVNLYKAGIQFKYFMR